METSLHANGSFNHAQTVLNWDPSSLEIKTRSVEKTLEPLVVQDMDNLTPEEKQVRLKKSRFYQENVS